MKKENSKQKNDEDPKNHPNENQEEIKEYKEELVRCPECGERVTLTDPIESNGEGVAFGYIHCEDPDCDFKAREEWIHDKTIKVKK